MEGYLHKQGALLKISWTKYWFVLEGTSLNYYKDPRGAESYLAMRQWITVIHDTMQKETGRARQSSDVSAASLNLDEPYPESDPESPMEIGSPGTQQSPIPAHQRFSTDQHRCQCGLAHCVVKNHNRRSREGLLTQESPGRLAPQTQESEVQVFKFKADSGGQSPSPPRPPRRGSRKQQEPAQAAFEHRREVEEGPSIPKRVRSTEMKTGRSKETEPAEPRPGPRRKEPRSPDVNQALSTKHLSDRSAQNTKTSPETESVKKRTQRPAERPPPPPISDIPPRSRGRSGDEPSPLSEQPRVPPRQSQMNKEPSPLEKKTKNRGSASSKDATPPPPPRRQISAQQQNERIPLTRPPPPESSPPRPSRPVVSPTGPSPAEKSVPAPKPRKGKRETATAKPAEPTEKPVTSDQPAPSHMFDDKEVIYDTLRKAQQNEEDVSNFLDAAFDKIMSLSGSEDESEEMDKKLGYSQKKNNAREDVPMTTGRKCNFEKVATNEVVQAPAREAIGEGVVASQRALKGNEPTSPSRQKVHLSMDDGLELKPIQVRPSQDGKAESVLLQNDLVEDTEGNGRESEPYYGNVVQWEKAAKGKMLAEQPAETRRSLEKPKHGMEGSEQTGDTRTSSGEENVPSGHEQGGLDIGIRLSAMPRMSAFDVYDGKGETGPDRTSGQPLSDDERGRDSVFVTTAPPESPELKIPKSPEIRPRVPQKPSPKLAPRVAPKPTARVSSYTTNDGLTDNNAAKDDVVGAAHRSGADSPADNEVEYDLPPGLNAERVSDPVSTAAESEMPSSAAVNELSTFMTRLGWTSSTRHDDDSPTFDKGTCKPAVPPKGDGIRKLKEYLKTVDCNT